MSSRRRTILVALLLTVLGGLLLPASAAAVPDADPDLAVSIRSLSPSRLAKGADVTVTGTVTNRDDHAWQQAQAYLVIPPAPFTTRAQVDAAVGNANAYTGARIVDTGTFDEIGDLAPGQTRRFRIQVPYEQLGLSGAEGVYPVGVQILATDTDGSRSPQALAGSTTFLPLISPSQNSAPTSVVWPFLMPDYRGPSGDYAQPAQFLRSVGPGGQLRNLLDLAASTPTGASTVLIDPALLVGVDDLARSRNVPRDVQMTAELRAAAEAFRDDLLALARSRSTWVLDFDRPDDLALSSNPDLAGPLRDAIDLATDSALQAYGFTGRHASWPTRGGVTAQLLGDLRGSGDAPAIVTPASLPDWEERLGSLVQYSTPRGPMPVLVNDLPLGDSPGGESVVTVRQRLLSDAALSALERAIDPTSRADAVAMIDPAWDPGVRWSTGQLSAAFSASFVQATSLDDVLAQSIAAYDGEAPTGAAARPISRSQLQAASDIVTEGRVLSSVIPRREDVDLALAREVAGVLGVRWRLDRSTGSVIARSRARQTGAELAKISIEAPPSVTLSSSKGGFPLTIRNDTASAIRIGVALDSSNPALSIPDIKPIAVGAGERRTITVQVDLQSQRTTFLTAHLQTPGGRDLGMPDTFKVRSSRIGVVLWAAMGAAALFVLVTLVRRFHRHRTRIASERLADDDD
ncbi:MAG: hypothetical protein JWP31_529 [Aeromicrobium sp.]|nr:hypothetical protein [Aeromicrobium sp.]